MRNFKDFFKCTNDVHLANTRKNLFERTYFPLFEKKRERERERKESKKRKEKINENLKVESLCAYLPFEALSMFLNYEFVLHGKSIYFFLLGHMKNFDTSSFTVSLKHPGSP